jgi:hypothetical protein
MQAGQMRWPGEIGHGDQIALGDHAGHFGHLRAGHIDHAPFVGVSTSTTAESEGGFGEPIAVSKVWVR